MIRDDLADAIRRELAALGVEPHEVTLERLTASSTATGRPTPPWSTPRRPAETQGAGAVARRQPRGRPAGTRGRVEIAGPGFVNVHLRDTWLHEVLRDVVAAGEDYGRRDRRGDEGQRGVRLGSPTGPLHAGHGHNAAYGDSVARLFERCGYRVEREYYLNDQGTQMDLYARSLAARKAGEDVPEDRYRR